MIVNQELSEIFNALKKTIELSKTNTGITTVTFHSLEDRIVKKFLI
jgi:Predicted S-adenosylmethionine-dependent methyltransferase involved in cell envelope biogenesis